MIVKRQIRARYNETDQMGVIYHANYFNWFTIGRDALFEELEVDYRALEESGIYLPVSEVKCKYIKSAKYNDRITIQAELVKFGGVKLEIGYKIFREDEILAEGYTIHGFVNKDMQPKILKKIDEQWHNKLIKAIKK